MKRQATVVLIAVSALLPASAMAQSDATKVRCAEFVQERLQAGAQFLQLLAVERVPSSIMSDADWQECRALMFRRIEAGWEDYEAQQKANLEEFKREIKQSGREYDQKVNQCEAGGGKWRYGKCKTGAEIARERQQKEQRREQRRREAQAAHDARIRKHEEAIARMQQEAEQRKAERERAKAEKRRRLEERRQQLMSGG